MTEGALPGKSAEAYRTIGEAAEALKLPQHVLRFWETRFPQVKPLKRAGGRRFYRPEDVALLRAIKILLYGEGYTIKGVQRLIQEQGPRAVAAAARAGAAGAVEPDHGRALAGRQGMAVAVRDDGARHGNSEPAAPSGPTGAARVAPSPASTPWAAGPPHLDPAGTRPSAGLDVVARLEAVVFDLRECERLLASARASRT